MNTSPPPPGEPLDEGAAHHLVAGPGEFGPPGGPDMRLRIGLVLSLALIGGFAAWVYAVTATPTYTARAYLATEAARRRVMPGKASST